MFSARIGDDAEPKGDTRTDVLFRDVHSRKTPLTFSTSGSYGFCFIVRIASPAAPVPSMGQRGGWHWSSWSNYARKGEGLITVDLL
jgi:hypothetical protein